MVNRQYKKKLKMGKMKFNSVMRRLTKIVLRNSIKLAAASIIKSAREEDNLMATGWINTLISKPTTRR